MPKGRSAAHTPTGWDLETAMWRSYYDHQPVRLFGQLSELMRTQYGFPFWRSIVGAFHQVSVKHLDRYLDEFSFRFDNRNNPYLFRDTLLRLINSENLEYKELTKEEAA